MAKVREIWRDLVITLREHHLSGPTREARFLLAEVLSTSPSRIYLFWDHEIAREKMEKLYLLLQDRLNGVPLQYVLREWEFFSLTFEMKRGVFIPRLDTESWVEEALLTLRTRFKTETGIVCDLCCGSGVIGITAAYWVPNIRVYGVDISTEAVDLALKNARKLGVDKQMVFVQSDLFDFFKSIAVIQFDMILCNPPYVKEDDWSTLSPEITGHESKIALVGGHDGLDLIRRIINDSPQFLKKDGLLYLEHDPSQVDAIADCAIYSSFQLDHVISDYQQQPRATVLIRK